MTSLSLRPMTSALLWSISTRLTVDPPCFSQHSIMSCTPFMIVRALVVDQAFLRLNTELVLVVNVRANARCPETAGSLMMVTFGATSVAGRDCDGQWNSSEKIISSG
jgi:hypothetical protein